MLFVLTAAAKQWIQDHPGQFPVMSEFRVGSGFGYFPTDDMTGLQGDVLYTGTPSGKSLPSGTFLYEAVMDSSVGPFHWGEVGFYRNEVLFAIGSQSTQAWKAATIGSMAGSNAVISAYVHPSSELSAAEVGNSSNELNVHVVPNIAQLPPAHLAFPNVVLVPSPIAPTLSVLATASGRSWSLAGWESMRFQGNLVSATANTLTIGDDVPPPSLPGEYLISILSGPASGLVRSAVAYDAVAKRFTLDQPLPVNPLAGDTVRVMQSSLASSVENLPPMLWHLDPRLAASDLNQLVDLDMFFSPLLRRDGLSYMTGNLNLDENRITSLADPVDEQDAATKAYVDAGLASIEDVATAAQTARTGAETARTGAETARTGAETARSEAEAARDAATVNADVYVDVATGLAAVTDGQQFQVVSADGLSIQRYRRDAGPVAVAVADYPSTALSPKALPPETGYVWALVDQDGRAAILVGLDGKVTLPKNEYSSFLPQDLVADSGYVWAMVDESNRIALGVKNTGEVVGGFQTTGTPSAAPTIWYLGDSLAAGVYTRMVPLLPDHTIIGAGIGGQKTDQIARRAGAFFALVSVAGNEIPASGPVTVSAIDVRILSGASNSGTSTMAGRLAGVPGVLSCAHDASSDLLDVYTFTRTTAGDAVQCLPGSPFLPDTNGRENGVVIIATGANDGGNIERIKTGVDAIVSICTASDRRFLIVTPPSGGPITPGDPAPPVAAYFSEYENWAAAKYGDRVFNVRLWSHQFGNGSADDIADIAAGIVPRSLRVDSVHWTNAFSQLVAEHLANQIISRGW